MKKIILPISIAVCGLAAQFAPAAPPPDVKEMLEGSVVMQLRGAEPVTLKAGETFYERPDDVHIVGRNASDGKPAKFVVVLVKKQGVPALLPAK